MKFQPHPDQLTIWLDFLDINAMTDAEAEAFSEVPGDRESLMDWIASRYAAESPQDQAFLADIIRESPKWNRRRVERILLSGGLILNEEMAKDPLRFLEDIKTRVLKWSANSEQAG